MYTYSESFFPIPNSIIFEILLSIKFFSVLRFIFLEETNFSRKGNATGTTSNRFDKLELNATNPCLEGFFKDGNAITFLWNWRDGDCFPPVPSRLACEHSKKPLNETCGKKDVWLTRLLCFFFGINIQAHGFGSCCALKVNRVRYWCLLWEVIQGYKRVC